MAIARRLAVRLDWMLRAQMDFEGGAYIEFDVCGLRCSKQKQLVDSY